MIHIFCYSRSGNTRRFAVQLAELLGAEVSDIEEENPRSGFIGFFLAGMHATLGWQSKIKPVELPGGNDATIVVCGPIWAGRISSPIRAFLQGLSGRQGKIAYLITRGDKANAYASAFMEMDKVSGMNRIACLSLCATEEKGQAESKLGRFADQIRSV